MTDELFASIFPIEESIPQKYRIASPMEQREYLCDGAIRHWPGPQQDVLSPLGIKTGKSIQQQLIGSYPLLTEEQSLEALEVSCRAYDHGRGE